METLEGRMLLDGTLIEHLSALDGQDSIGVQERIVTADDPANHVEGQGGFTGVALLTINTFFGRFSCTGSLISERHILTAAHCVAGIFGRVTARSVLADFVLPGPDARISSTDVVVHPGYRGSVMRGNDLAIVELEESAPFAAAIYDIYRQTDEVGQVSVKVGYGLTGQGNEGETTSDSLKRSGLNQYDAPGEIYNQLFPFRSPVLPGTQLAYDFDNGLAQNDAFGNVFGIEDTGFGADEVNSAQGDSGGPTFIDGKIAGVTSWGISSGATDVHPGTDSSFGEFSFDTRVSTYAAWIDSVIGNAASAAAATIPALGRSPAAALARSGGAGSLAPLALSAPASPVSPSASIGIGIVANQELPDCGVMPPTCPASWGARVDQVAATVEAREGGEFLLAKESPVDALLEALVDDEAHPWVWPMAEWAWLEA